MTEGMIQGHRRLSGPTETPDGFPLPLTSRPLTKTPVVVKQEGVELKAYPEAFIPGQEELGQDEIRLTCIGSGNPVVRRAQAATGWLCGSRMQGKRRRETSYYTRTRFR
jgi:hypothetical protein